MNRAFSVLIFVFSVLGCNKDNPEPSTPLENIAGTYYRTLMTSDGEEREFIVYVPESAVGTQNVPVVVFVHGTGSTGETFHDNPNLWIPKADEEGFITVHPTALIHCHFDNGIEKTTTKWAHGDLGETNTQLGALPLCTNERLANDLEFFDRMLDVLKADYLIDEKRIYISGNSNGAGMGLRLAAERSDVFAAVAVNAGLQSQFLDRSITTRPMSIVVTVGTNDHLFAQGIGTTIPVTINESLINSVSAFLQPVLDVHALGETSQYVYSEVYLGNRMTGRFLFNNSTQGNNNSFRFIVIEGFGHSYNPDLIDGYWDFLKEQSLP
jgi:polyhydroxybutyrate depolymerase